MVSFSPSPFRSVASGDPRLDLAVGVHRPVWSATLSAVHPRKATRRSSARGRGGRGPGWRGHHHRRARRHRHQSKTLVPHRCLSGTWSGHPPARSGPARPTPGAAKRGAKGVSCAAPGIALRTSPPLVAARLPSSSGATGLPARHATWSPQDRRNGRPPALRLNHMPVEVRAAVEHHPETGPGHQQPDADRDQSVRDRCDPRERTEPGGFGLAKRRPSTPAWAAPQAEGAACDGEVRGLRQRLRHGVRDHEAGASTSSTASSAPPCARPALRTLRLHDFGHGVERGPRCSAAPTAPKRRVWPGSPVPRLNYRLCGGHQPPTARDPPPQACADVPRHASDPFTGVPGLSPSGAL